MYTKSRNLMEGRLKGENDTFHEEGAKRLENVESTGSNKGFFKLSSFRIGR